MPALKEEQPLGKMLSTLGKGYLSLLRARLQHLEIDRNYYALILIESREGQITQQELALLLGTEKVSIVRVIDYLSEKGYVKRMRKPGDKRSHSLVLTEKAKLALPEIKQAISETNSLVLKGIEEKQVSVFITTLAKLKQNITENTQFI